MTCRLPSAFGPRVCDGAIVRTKGFENETYHGMRGNAYQDKCRKICGLERVYVSKYIGRSRQVLGGQRFLLVFPKIPNQNVFLSVLISQ